LEAFGEPLEGLVPSKSHRRGSSSRRFPAGCLLTKRSVVARIFQSIIHTGPNETNEGSFRREVHAGHNVFSQWRANRRQSKCKKRKMNNQGRYLRGTSEPNKGRKRRARESRASSPRPFAAEPNALVREQVLAHFLVSKGSATLFWQFGVPPTVCGEHWRLDYH